MKPSPKENALILSSSVLMMALIFYRPLGLPDYCESIFVLAAMVCLYLFYRSRRRTKSQQTDITTGIPFTPNRGGNLRLLILAVGTASVLFPFLAPYTSLTLPFPQLVIISIISYCICVSVIAFGRHKQQ